VRSRSLSSMSSGSCRARRVGRGWRREARRQLEQHRWGRSRPGSALTSERLLLAAERLEQELKRSGWLTP